MNFSYTMYFNGAFLTPLLIVIFMTFIFVSVIHSFTKQILQHCPPIIIARSIFFLLVLILCTLPQIKCLANGGWKLITEKDADAKTSVGIVENIVEPSKRLSAFKINHCHGADITINGVTFFIMTAGDIHIGEPVSIKYLPNSHFIMEMQRTGDDSLSCHVLSYPVLLLSTERKLYELLL